MSGVTVWLVELVADVIAKFIAEFVTMVVTEFLVEVVRETIVVWAMEGFKTLQTLITSLFWVKK